MTDILTTVGLIPEIHLSTVKYTLDSIRWCRTHGQKKEMCKLWAYSHHLCFGCSRGTCDGYVRKLC